MNITRIRSYIKHTTLKMVGWWGLPRTHHQEIVPNSVCRILVYGDMGIGNMIMLTPALSAIRRSFPQAKITLLVGHSGCEEVVRGSLLVDEIIKVTKTNLWNILKLAMRIRRQHFNLLVATFHSNKEYLGFLTALSGVPLRASHCTSPDWKNEYDYLYNIPVSMWEAKHEVKRGLRLAEALGCPCSDDSPFFSIDENADTFANQFFKNNHLSEKDWLLGVQAGTWKIQAWKEWDLEKLAKTCDRLIKDYGIKIVLLGSSDNQDTLKVLLSYMRNQPIIALGKATLKESAAIIKRCNATLCNDSGLMHISVAVGTPTVAIVGPTDWRRTGPYGTGHMIVKKDLACSPCFTLSEIYTAHTVNNCLHRMCLNSITVGEVVKAIIKIKGAT